MVVVVGDGDARTINDRSVLPVARLAVLGSGLLQLDDPVGLVLAGGALLGRNLDGGLLIYKGSKSFVSHSVALRARLPETP